MKSTRTILLVIGILGLLASVYNFWTGSELFEVMTGIVASSALIYGYFHFGNSENSNREKS